MDDAFPLRGIEPPSPTLSARQRELASYFAAPTADRLTDEQRAIGLGVARRLIADVAACVDGGIDAPALWADWLLTGIPCAGPLASPCFARGEDPQVVTVAARLHRVIENQHGFTEHSVVLPGGRWRDVLSGSEFDGGSALIADLLEHYPAAVLEKVASPPGPEIQIPLFRPGVRHQPTPTEHRGEDAEVTGLLGWLTKRFFDKHDDGQTHG